MTYEQRPPVNNGYCFCGVLGVVDEHKFDCIIYHFVHLISIESKDDKKSKKPENLSLNDCF